MRRPRIIVPLTMALASAATLAACSAAPADEAEGPDMSGVPAEFQLAGACPDTVVIQTIWLPEVDHGTFYNLVGEGYTIDGAANSVTGPLTVDGYDTGVDVEIRAGGPSIGFQPPEAVMYQDTSITLASTTTENRLLNYGTVPTTAVLATRQISPLMLFWDPETHPDWTGIEDFGPDTTVVTSGGALYGAILSSKGYFSADNIEETYDGGTARFVSDPSIGHEGFITSEKAIFETETPQWNKPIAYQLLADAGLDIYPDAVSVRTGDLETLAPCLEKLVPIMQQSSVDYLSDPSYANDLIVKAVEEYATFWVYSPNVAELGYQQTVDNNLMTGDGTTPAGGFSEAKVASSIDIIREAWDILGVNYDPSVTGDDIFTNEFIDPSITF